jgi:hypothetical protein
MSSSGILSVLVCVCAIGTGCGESSASNEATLAKGATEVAGRAGASAAGETRSACELITDEEASEIVGSPVLPKEKSRGGSSSSCFFAPAPGQTQEFQLKVHWSGGREAWEANEKATELGGRLMGADRNEAAARVTKVDEVPLGDRSYYNPILGAYVLKGDVLIEFNNLLTLSDARVKWEKLARKALSRL